MPIAADIYYHIYPGAEEGQKPSIVLIHGAGGTHLSWPSEVRRLSGYRMYALDLPGHGKSGGRGHQTIAAYSDSLVQWMGEVGLHGAVFIGHSMGSAIALLMALEHPEHVLGLGLVGAGARLKVMPALLESSASETAYPQVLEAVVSLSFGPHTPAALLAAVTQRMSEIRPSVLHSDFLACSGFNVSDRVGSIRQPTLIICGAEDRMTPLRYAQFLAGSIPGARLEIIPEAGHMVMLERPLALAGLVRQFLDQTSY